MKALTNLLTPARRAKYLRISTVLRNLPLHLAEVVGMGRRAEGCKVRWKRGWAYACFTHAGVEHRIALGTQDGDEAAKRAPVEYARVVLGRRPTKPSTNSLSLTTPLAELLDEYIAVTEGSLDEETRKTLRIYARKFVAFFGASLLNVNDATIADYGRTRLRQVLRTTVLKERSSLRMFLAWCKDERKLIDEVPAFADLPKKATGVRVGKQRATPVEITRDEAIAMISKLPEWSKSIGGRKWPVRMRYLVAWETGLRPETLARLSVPDSYSRGSKQLTLQDADDKARYGRAVPLSVVARAALDRVAPDAGPIFGRHNFSKAIKAAAREVLDEEKAKRFAQYDFRHGRATQLAEQTGNLPATAYLLGHRRLTTTDKYLRGSRRAAEHVLALVDGPFPDRHAGEIMNSLGGDRRGLNPRQLEPQSSEAPVYAEILLDEGPRELRTARVEVDSRTGYGFIDSAVEVVALDAVTDEFLDAFGDVEASELLLEQGKGVA